MSPGSALTDARDAAWVGRHAAVVEAAAQALQNASTPAATRIEWLDLRAASLAALGRYAEAMADAEAMLALASTPRLRPQRVRALCRGVHVALRIGQLSQVVAHARDALELARQLALPALQADALATLAEAQLRTTEHTTALETARRAAAAYEALGDRAGLGRSWWLQAFALSRLSRDEASREAALRAAELARESGDNEGLGHALNVLTFGCKDIAQRMHGLQQARDAFDRAGNVWGRMMVVANLAGAYAELGLYGHAQRLGQEVLDAAHASGVRVGAALQLSGLIRWRLDMGRPEDARRLWPELERLVDGLEAPIVWLQREMCAAALALHEQRHADAVTHLRSALAQVAHHPAEERDVQCRLAQACLASGLRREALQASSRAAELHRTQGYARADFGHSQDIWWWHAQALRANGRHADAWRAMRRAHAILLEGVRNVHDAGLRRCYLGKVAVNRAIVAAWLRESRRRGLSDARRLAHLAATSRLGEPFQRLVAIGNRINAQHSGAAVHDLLVEEVTELTGAQRVLLLLETEGDPRCAASQLPADEPAHELQRAIALGSTRRGARVPCVCATAPTAHPRFTSARA